MHILIADDEAPSRGELRYILEALEPGAVFYEATDGAEALRSVDREPIDVAFLDVRMPGLDGLAVAAAVMERPEPPLIVFAMAYDEHLVRAFERGGVDHVVKPFDERRLAQAMGQVRQALKDRGSLARKQAALGECLSQVISS